MIQSMTGYAERKFGNLSLTGKVSIKTLNHRFFDWYYRGVQLGRFESKLRTICQKRLYRGRVEVTLELHFLDSSRWEIWFDEDLVKRMISSLEKICADRKTPLTFSIDNIFSIPQAVEIKRRDLNREEGAFLEKHFAMTLDDLIESRQREGRQIQREIQASARRMNRVLRRLEKLADSHSLTIRRKLEQRLRELKAEAEFSEERIVEETSHIAQKYDLTEEITRLKSHLNHLKELISLEAEDGLGKKLDFVAQELSREANTINSKAQDIEIIKDSLAIKNEVESIRQLVQNIE